jgi:hypothetical protein
MEYARHLLVLGALLLASCAPDSMQKQPMMTDDEIREAFIREAKDQGVRVTRVLPDGRVLVERDGTELSLSLENLVRNVRRDGDVAAIGRFVTTVKGSRLDLPNWQNSQPRLRFAVEPADHEFGGTLREMVTDDIVRVLVYVTPDESRITWIDEVQLQTWGVPAAEAWAAASMNMSALLAATPIQIEPIDDMQLGMFDSESVFKASLVLSPNLKKVLAPKIGWPIYAVIPCRDFAYFFRSKDLIPRVGKTVVEEYKASGYPITPDVLLISDSGIEAIGTFPVH